MNPITEEHSRIADCECGAQLEGDSGGSSSMRHTVTSLIIPSSQGPVGLDVVQQMVRGASGAINA